MSKIQLTDLAFNAGHNASFFAAHGLRNISIEQVEKASAEMEDTGAFVQDGGDFYILGGPLGEMTHEFFKSANWSTGKHILREMVSLAIKSGTPRSLATEWESYQRKRFMNRK